MQRLEVGAAVGPLKWSLGVKWLRHCATIYLECERKTLVSGLRYEPITPGVRRATHLTVVFG
jgi:hypothetical protein